MKTALVIGFAVGCLLSQAAGVAAEALAAAKDQTYPIGADALQPLFLPPPVTTRASVRTIDAHALRHQFVRLNSQLLEPGRQGLLQPGARATLNLWDDEALTLQVNRVDVNGPGEFVCSGEVEGMPGSVVLLALVGDAMTGNIIVPGRPTVQVQYRGDRLHCLNEVSPQAVEAWRPQVARNVVRLRGSEQSVGADTLEPGEFTGAKELAGTGLNPVIIDFLVLYTPRALAGAGGEAGINALLDFAEAEANFSYANSGVNVRWNFVYRGLINYTESGDVCADQTWLLNNSGSLSSTTRADLALMIVENDNGGYSGCAGGRGGAFVRSAVNAGMYLVIHEVSHLFGAGHDRFTCGNFGDSNCGAAFSYSYGHRFVADGVTYGTIMSYEPGIRIPYFSNPEVLFHGVPTGVAGGTNAANNARTIRETAPTIAAYEKPVNRIELASSEYWVEEGAGNLTVEVLRSGGTNATKVQLVAVSGTATVETDFVAPTNQVAFGVGQTRQSVSVAILPDTLSEGPETFTLKLRSPQVGSALGLRSGATVVISDPETYIRFPTNLMVLSEGAGSVDIPIERGGDTNSPVTVDFVVTNVTARAEEDFRLQPGQVSFAAGETQKAIRLEIVDDLVSEAEESLIVALENPSHGGITAPTTLQVIIADNDRPGSIDSGFDVGLGPNNRVYGLRATADGGIFCCGRFTQIDGQPVTALVKLLPNGAVDKSFRSPIFLLSLTNDPNLHPAHIAGVLAQVDGRLLIWGEFASVNGVLRTHLARLDADGTLDLSFAVDPGPNGAAYDGSGFASYSVAVQPDGKILVGGGFNTVNGVTRRMVARLNSDGTLDSTFQAVPNKDSTYICAVALQPDGRVLVGGRFTGFEGVAKPYFARLDANGKLDRAFRPGLAGMAMKIQVLPDSRLLVGGFFNARAYLARFSSRGEWDTSFRTQPPLNGHVYDFEVLPDGRIMVVGSFTSPAGVNRSRVARLHADGSLDTTFDAGVGANDIVRAVLIQPDGRVVVGGHFTAVNGLARSYLTRLQSDGTQPAFALPTVQTGGQWLMRLYGNAGRAYVTEYSTDLSTWLPHGTNRFNQTFFEWLEPPAAGAERYYRAREQSD